MAASLQVCLRQEFAAIGYLFGPEVTPGHAKVPKPLPQTSQGSVKVLQSVSKNTVARVEFCQ